MAGWRAAYDSAAIPGAISVHVPRGSFSEVAAFKFWYNYYGFLAWLRELRPQLVAKAKSTAEWFSDLYASRKSEELARKAAWKYIDDYCADVSDTGAIERSATRFRGAVQNIPRGMLLAHYGASRGAVVEALRESLSALRKSKGINREFSLSMTAKELSI